MNTPVTQAMRQHTPGPWYFDGDWGRLPTIFAPDWRTKIAVVEKTSRNEHTTEQAANARLIAAAPNQHDALTAAPRPFTAIDDPDKLSAFIIEYADWFFKVRHPAIAKAEGREP